MMPLYGSTECSVAQFRVWLAGSNLLDDAGLSQLDLLAVQASTGAELAGELVERRLLTRWQAEQLLSGRTAFYLGKYVLLRKLGAGGMGAVYQAHHAALNRVVAVKVLAPALVDSPRAISRFQREIQIAAALDHPNIVRAYDAESVGDTHFLVMEYVDGADLEHVLRTQGILPVSLACELIRQAAVALEYARGQGVVHRDLKPANLLVVRQEGAHSPLLKILDMGLARLTTDLDSGLTGTGEVMGTPDYMAPEQVYDMRAVDTRSDLYSLGCTLYRLISGRVPFPDGSVFEKLNARLHRDAPLLSSAAPHAPVELERIVARALARDPAERYQSPADLAADLTPCCPAAGAEPTQRTPSLADAAATAAIFSRPTLEQSLADTVLLSPSKLDPIAPRRDTGLDQFLSALACAASDDDNAQPVLEFRRQRRRKELGYAAALLTLIVLSMAGYLGWEQAGQVLVAVEWPEAERTQGELLLNGKPVDVPARGRFVLKGAAGHWNVELERPGYESHDFTLEIPRGGRETITPRWKPLPQTVRRAEWNVLKARLRPLHAVSGPDAAFADVINAHRELASFARRWPGTPESHEVDAFRRSLPWPVDRLDR